MSEAAPKGSLPPGSRLRSNGCSSRQRRDVAYTRTGQNRQCLNLAACAAHRESGCRIKGRTLLSQDPRAVASLSPLRHTKSVRQADLIGQTGPSYCSHAACCAQSSPLRPTLRSNLQSQGAMRGYDWQTAQVSVKMRRKSRWQETEAKWMAPLTKAPLPPRGSKCPKSVT